MQISHLTDKGDGLVNEDTQLISSNIFGIFDGATGLTKYVDALGNTGGLLASLIAKKTFEKNSSQPLINLISEINKELRTKMQNVYINDTDAGAAWTTTASVVRISKTSVEYLQLGDSPIVFILNDGSIKTLHSDHDLETLLLWKKLSSEGVKDIRNDEQMVKQLLKTRNESNITHGVLNGMNSVLPFVSQNNIPLIDIKEILIFSDGMLFPQENPGDPEDIQRIIDLYNKGGLELVKENVRNIENMDPNCLKYPRFKQHDDLSAIAITLD